MKRGPVVLDRVKRASDEAGPASPSAVLSRIRRRHVLRRAAVLYLVAWAATWIFGVPQIEAEYLRIRMDVSEREQAYAAKQLAWREEHRVWLLQDIAQSDDPEYIERASRWDLEPIPADAYPNFWAHAWSPAPFILVLDEGRTLAPLSGSGHKGLHLWLLGMTCPAVPFRVWVA